MIVGLFLLTIIVAIEGPNLPNYDIKVHFNNKPIVERENGEWKSSTIKSIKRIKDGIACFERRGLRCLKG